MGKAPGDEKATGSDHEYSGIVSTRNHFETIGVRPFLGVKLRGRHDQYGFDVKGRVPGYTSDEPDGELLVFVHGFDNDPPSAREIFDEATEALHRNSYVQPVVGYSWDSLGDVRWYQAVDIAWRNGPKLANFIHTYKQENPGVRLRIIAHSLGSQVVLSALTWLHTRSVPGIHGPRWNHCIDSVSFIGAAVDRRAPLLRGSMHTHLGNYYSRKDQPVLGPVIEQVTDRFYDYYSNDDEVLDLWFQAAEFTSALGQYGARKPKWTPFNYFDVDVTDAVSSHSDYYKPGKGCMDRVVDAWRYGSHRYRIVNANSGLSLALDHDSPEKGVDVVQHEVDFIGDDGGPGDSYPEPADWKYWRLRNLKNGRYLLSAVETGEIAQVAEPSSGDGADLQQWTWNGSPFHQVWNVEHAGDGKYRLRYVQSNRVAQVTDGSEADGATVVQWEETGDDDQHWWLYRYRNEYRVANVGTDGVLAVADDSTEDGANVYRWDWLGHRNQRWQVQYLRDREYRLVNVNSRKVLDVADGSKEDGANVRQWHWTGDDSQRWYVQGVGNGESRVVNKHSEKVLDVTDGGTENGTNVQQSDWRDEANQRFRFRSV